jgi:hypothetical protein
MHLQASGAAESCRWPLAQIGGRGIIGLPGSTETQRKRRCCASARNDFSHADAVGRRTVFNIHGNHYRLVARVNYRTGRVFIPHILTHVEYNKGAWIR